jgi:hypothetical protein
MGLEGKWLGRSSWLGERASNFGPKRLVVILVLDDGHVAMLEVLASSSRKPVLANDSM